MAIHPKAPAAHAAAEAAHRQGKFFEMYKRIFANQAEMSPTKYEGYAAEMGLDVEQFKKDVASAEVKQRIAADVSDATKLQITSTLPGREDRQPGEVDRGRRAEAHPPRTPVAR